MPTDEQYIIVCKDLHGAVGVFGSYEEALKAARAYTDEGRKLMGLNCVFMPVILDMARPIKKGRKTEDRSHPGQYL